MNPDIDTSFLPDVDREERERAERERLRQEWEGIISISEDYPR